MKRKFLSIAMAAAMLLSVFAINAYADDDISFSYDDDEYEEEPIDYDDYYDDEDENMYDEYEFYYDEDGYGEYSETPYGEENGYLNDAGKESKEEEDDGAIKVFYQGERIVFDVAPVIVDGRTLVPMRAIFEKLGAEVGWDAETRTVTAVKGEITVSLEIGSPYLYVGDKETELDVPAQIVEDRTLVPLRAVSEAFGTNVGWDGDKREITIE